MLHRAPTVTDKAAQWLREYLERKGPSYYNEIMDDSPFNDKAIRRAADRLNIISTNQSTYPRRAIWSLPDPNPTHPSRIRRITHIEMEEN